MSIVLLEHCECVEINCVYYLQEATACTRLVSGMRCRCLRAPCLPTWLHSAPSAVTWNLSTLSWTSPWEPALYVATNDARLKPRPHQQLCRMLQVERFFRQCRMLLRHCCRFGNNVAGFGNYVEQNFVLSTKSKQIAHVNLFRLRRKDEIYNRIVRHCCRLWQQSRMLLRQSRTLLRHCCWCGRGFGRTSWADKNVALYFPL